MPVNPLPVNLRLCALNQHGKESTFESLPDEDHSYFYYPRVIPCTLSDSTRVGAEAQATIGAADATIVPKRRTRLHRCG